MPWEEDPPSKVFKPKNLNLRVLDEYPREGDFGDDYWKTWIRRDYESMSGSLVNHNAVREVANRLGYKDMNKIDYICKMLDEGAVLGVQGEGRWPSEGINSKTVYEFGNRVADSLQSGILDGYLCGPLSRDDIDKIWPQGVKISPMMTRMKPNGSIRIIMDLSYPHDVSLGQGVPCSPNEGLKHYEEFQKVEMTSDKSFRKAMFWSGWPVEVMKSDWSIAYKHISVNPDDHALQLVFFGGRYFVERCLTFGGATSPTLYNLVAKLLIEFAEIASGMDSRHNCQQLDDNCTAGAAGSLKMWEYLRCYRSLAAELGVRLAPEDDPSKAFPPSSSGEILGLLYDGSSWKWQMPVSKGLRLLYSLGTIIRSGEVTNGVMQTVAGRINHYSILVNGKFNRCLLLHIAKEDEEDDTVIVIRKQRMICFVWWLVNLRSLQNGGARIPNPSDFLPNTALDIQSDAAGGASKRLTQGWGLVNMHVGEWARGSWPLYITSNTVHNGQKWGRKLSFLEGFACLMTVPLWAKQIQEAGGAALMCDNMGFMFSHTNGSSRDEYVWTIAKCISSLSEGLGVPIKVFHTRRRTAIGDSIADDLSKNKIDDVVKAWPHGKDVTGDVSQVLLKWLESPKVDMELGREVLKELKVKSLTEVNIGVSYASIAMEIGAVIK